MVNHYRGIEGLRRKGAGVKRVSVRRRRTRVCECHGWRVIPTSGGRVIPTSRGRVIPTSGGRREPHKEGGSGDVRAGSSPSSQPGLPILTCNNNKNKEMRAPSALGAGNRVDQFHTPLAAAGDRPLGAPATAGDVTPGGRGGATAARHPASHQVEPGYISDVKRAIFMCTIIFNAPYHDRALTICNRWAIFPAGSPPGFSHVGIVLGDAAGRRVYSGISRSIRPCSIFTSPRPHRLSRPRPYSDIGRKTVQLWNTDSQLNHRGSKLDPRSDLRSAQITVAPFEFRAGLEIEMNLNQRNQAALAWTRRCREMEEIRAAPNSVVLRADEGD
ncbi:hypothetical protein PR048_031439 [Dryococelus australis]|uniref:Uncharacterized protein n=1 Tax=Dryococelus australis TaxID=614101 RepID=A0ABQ9G595_9NEOP|nr:hypothetical protein PR048_031439 [Dryococelus australis]